MRNFSHTALILYGLLFLLNSAIAHDPELKSALPTGGQRGTSLKLVCSGNRLDKARTILFYQPGISVGSPEIKSAKEVIFPITIAQDAKLGEYLFRVHCSDGISYVSSFWVGQFPEINEQTASNESISEAQTVELNQTINGITNTEDVDYYKISLKKDQIFSAELAGMRLGRTFYDPHLSLMDASEKTVISSDDSLLHKQDPSLTYKAPVDGDYFLAVREASYQGNGNSHYRLQIGDFLIPKSIYPLGAQRGKESEFEVFSDHLPPFKLQKTFSDSQIIQPFSAATNFLTNNSPHRIRVTDYGFYNETNPNDNLKKSSQTITPEAPFAFHGTIEKDRDQDWYKFKAKKDQKLRATVFANALASPLDSVIQLRNADGNNISGNDDQTQGVPDSKLDFVVPADGIYWLRITDKLDTGSPHHHYRIELTEQESSVDAELSHVRIQESQKWKAFDIPQGNRVCYEVSLTKSGVKDELELIADQLPQGVKIRQLKLSKGDNKTILYLEASGDAPINAGLFPLKLTTPDKKLTTPIITTVYPFLGDNNIPFTTYTTDKTAIAVTDPVPVLVEIIQPSQPIVRSGTMSVTVKVKRPEGFDEEIDLQMPWKPAGIGVNYSSKIPKGESETTLELAADSGAALGKWDFCIRAIFNTKSGRVQTCSNIIQIEVKEPYLSGKIAMAATSQGENTSIICSLDQQTDYEGKIKLTLYGLPDGITAETVEITKDMTEVVIPVTVPADARTGKHSNLFCRVNIPQDAFIIPHTIGQGGTLRVNPAAKVKPDAAPQKAAKVEPEKPKKPLSRLEQLRQK